MKPYSNVVTETVWDRETPAVLILHNSAKRFEYWTELKIVQQVHRWGSKASKHTKAPILSNILYTLYTRDIFQHAARSPKLYLIEKIS